MNRYDIISLMHSYKQYALSACLLILGLLGDGPPF
jgi:hypothetical protein